MPPSWKRKASGQSEILKAEGEKQSLILEAEGRRESAFRDAEAREREAEAEAKATQMVSAAIASGDVQAINYFVANKYVEAFQALATSRNQKTLILPMEATSLLGSLSGIGEIAKEAFGDKDQDARTFVPRSEYGPSRRRSLVTLIENTISALGPWTWFVLGLLLLGLEIVAPGSIFLWFGLSAIAVGVVALIFDPSWQILVSLFLVLSIVSLLVGRRMMRKLASEAGDPGLNQRGSRYIGREFTLQKPLSEGAGNLSIDDTIWRITGPDLPAGTKVRVDSIDGARLVVSQVE